MNLCDSGTESLRRTGSGQLKRCEFAKALGDITFIFPTAALLGYERYDCTGQQLINQGFVLINGERVSVDLQSSER